MLPARKPAVLSRLTRLALFLIVAALLILLIRSPHSPEPPASPAQSHIIHGRWKEVHAVFGLPALPDFVSVSRLSVVDGSVGRDRFGLARGELRRRQETLGGQRAETEVPLFLADDSVDEPLAGEDDGKRAADVDAGVRIGVEGMGRRESRRSRYPP